MPSYYHRRSAYNPVARGNSIWDLGAERGVPRYKRSILRTIRDAATVPNNTPKTTNTTTTPFPTWGYGVIVAGIVALCLIVVGIITLMRTNWKGKEEKNAKKRSEGIDGVSSETSQKGIEVTTKSRQLSGSTARDNVEDGDIATMSMKHGDKELPGKDYEQLQQGLGGDLSAGEYRGRESRLGSHGLNLGVAGRNIPLALMRMTKSEQKALKKLPLIRVNEKGELEPVKKKKKKPATIAISNASSTSEFENVDLEKQASVSA
jgi:hypothetical protein